MGLERLDQVLGGLQQVRGSSSKGFGDLLKGLEAENLSLKENTIMIINLKKEKEKKISICPPLNLDAFMR